MVCPKCNKGRIRVITAVACGCGHHPLICDDCAQVFLVPCGPPFGPGTLPPDVEMEEDNRMLEACEQLQADPRYQGPTTPYRDLMRKEIADQPDDYPPLEDFKRPRPLPS